MAPGKMRFTVYGCSGEDPDNPARELHFHSPQTRGWQCPRFCKYPQEVTLQLEKPAMLQQIQILSHEHKIAKKIELHVGNLAPGIADPSQCTFNRLGHLSFDPNESSGHQVRELKSVHVNTPAFLLRLVVHRCHTNKLNIYNQVGLIAVNLIGEPLENLGPQPALQYPGAKPSGPAAAADIALDMNVDPQTAEKIREVLIQKEAAVAAEDYDEAKRLKDSVQHLKEVGMKVAQLEAQKRAAVENEDYDRAKQLKGDIEALRAGGASAAVGLGDAALQVPRAPRSPRTPHPAPDPSEPPSAAPSQRAPSRPATAEAPPPAEPPAPMPPPATHGNYANYDDRPAVAGAGMHAEAPPEQPSGAPAALGSDGFPPDLPTPEPLTAANLKEASSLIDIFGEYTVTCLFSKNWILRDAALQKIQKQVEEGALQADTKEVFRALSRALLRALKDKVANVFHAALALTRTAVEVYGAQVGSKELQMGVGELVAPLVEKTGDSNARMKEAAADTLMFLAHRRDVGLALMLGPFLRSVKNQAAWKPVKGRLDLLLQFVPEFGIAKGGAEGFPLEGTMSFINDAFASPNGDVRSTAMNLAFEVYKIVGKAIEKFFPKTLKPQIRDALNEGFARIDGGEADAMVDKMGARGGAPSAPSPAPPGAAPGKEAAAAGAPEGPGDEGSARGGEHAAHDEAAGAAGDDGDLGEDEGEGEDVCQFCGLKDPHLAEGENMDLHFYNDCAMLCSCKECGQIIEISSYNDHLLNECENLEKYRECPRCLEAIHADELPAHQEKNTCVVAKPIKMYNRCPLCHMDIPPGEEGWKKHLLEDLGCPNNERKMPKN